MESPPAYSQPEPLSMEKHSPHQNPFDTSPHLNTASSQSYPRGPVLPIPPADASSTVVSAYIRSFLLSKADIYNLEPEDISQLSQVWKHGTGQELRDYDLATFRDLYGVQMGAVIHKQVLSDKQSPAQVLVLLLVPVTLVPFAITLLIIRNSKGPDSRENTVAMVLAASFLLLSSVVTTIVTIIIWLALRRSLNKRRKVTAEFYEGGDGMEMPLMRGHGDEEENL